MIKRLTMSYAPGFRIWPEYEVCYDNVRFRVQFKGLWGPWSWTRNGRQLLYNGDTGVLSADRRFEAGIVTEFSGTTVISGDEVFFRPMNQPWFKFSLYRNVGPKKTATDKFDRYAKTARGDFHAVSQFLRFGCCFSEDRITPSGPLDRDVVRDASFVIETHPIAASHSGNFTTVMLP